MKTSPSSGAGARQLSLKQTHAGRRTGNLANARTCWAYALQHDAMGRDAVITTNEGTPYEACRRLRARPPHES
jgi:hypothetical protein